MILGKTKYFCLIFLFLFLNSCSLQKMALGTMSPMFYNATADMQGEGNWENFKSGTLANLKLIEGLLSLKPKDEHLLINLVKGYTGYAYGVNETLFLKDRYAENDKKFQLNQALANYAKAIEFGERFLAINGLSLDQLVQSMKGQGPTPLLEKAMDKSQLHFEGVIFLAQALGGYINLQRNKMDLVARLPVVKGMFDWVCGHQPNINAGTCMIFYGSYSAGRPKMLGGNPEEGRRIFEKAIKTFPHNWLIRSAYIENYIIPMSDEELYKKHKKFLVKSGRLLRQQLKFRPGKAQNNAFNEKSIRLFQAIAVKRAEIIKKYESDLF